MLEHITISNGICWSADGRDMYYIDSPTRTVRQYTCTESGVPENGRELINWGDVPEVPDGMTIDAEGRMDSYVGWLAR